MGESESYSELSPDDTQTGGEAESSSQLENNADYRIANFGKIYDQIKSGQAVDIGIFGEVCLEIDEEKLGLEKVNLEYLQQAWEKQKESWTKQCQEADIKLDPFLVFKYYLIQRKAFQVLGKAIELEGPRRQRQIEHHNKVKLSEMRGLAMCSEYAALIAYMAQKIGEPAHLIIGMTPTGDEQWREGHAYVYIDGENIILDGVMARSDNEFPCIMVPENGGTLVDMENGFDINATRIGTNFKRIYGLDAGGFGVTIKE